MPYTDPDEARDYQRTYRRLQRAGERTSGVQPVPLDFRLKTAADVLALLEDQCAAVLDDEAAGTLEKARVVGYLATISLKAIEAGNLAARIETLEAVLKRRKDAN